MFEKILIANRGEIAVRVIRACRDLGIRSVAIFSEADRNALHVQLADEAYAIGPAPAVESYLRIPAIIEAARRSGAQAIHPGYGFLSENSDFAAACWDAGVVFIGPPATSIRLMGDKVLAKRAVESTDVPTVPGFHGDEAGLDRLVAAAGAIGYPVLVKAAAGGGGRGMRVVDRPDGLAEAIEAAKREAGAAFGDDRIFLERYVERPRHIEIQILADTHGRIIHLGERECSIQRRHQKVLEESPSIAVPPDLRARLGAAAVAVARAAGYVSAGTVEFLLDADDQFYFLEMNTRLQVEHPVTEAVTGVDLVQWQIRIAAGEPLTVEQSQVRQSGHAIEVRIYAEDPERGFLPAAGRISEFRPPEGPGIRNDAGVFSGAEVPVHYDPMLAKLIAHGPDRATAIERLRSAIEDYRVGGITTNLRFLGWLVDQPAFRAGDTTTDFLDRNFDPAALRQPVPEEVLIGAAAADLLAWDWTGGGRGGGSGDPWSAGGPWRLGRVEVPLAYQTETGEVSLRASHLSGATWRFHLPEQTVMVEIESGADRNVLVRLADRTLAFQVERADNRLALRWRGRPYRFDRPVPAPPEALVHSGHGGAGEAALRAPMTGTVVKVLVQAGEVVEPLQSLIVIEAMKMEHVIQAPHAGIVSQIHCQPGDLVAGGAVLIDLAPE